MSKREWCIVYSFGKPSEIVLASFAKKTDAYSCLGGFHEIWQDYADRFSVAHRDELNETEFEHERA